MQMFSAASWRRPASTLLVLLLSSLAVAPRDAAAAAAVSEDVPVPGGTAALAQALGIDPAPDRGRFVYEITRLLYNAPEGRKPSADTLPGRRAPGARRGRPNADTRPGDLVPVPLTADLWSTRDLPSHASRRAISSPRSSPTAPRRCCVSGSRRSTMGRSASSPIIRSCSSGSTNARRRPSRCWRRSLRVQGNRVVPPGGDAAVALWEGADARKGHARRSLHPAAARAERRTAGVSVRRDRHARSARGARLRSACGYPTPRRAPSDSRR